MSYPLADLLSDLSDLEVITDPSQVEKLSQDYYSFSPVLQSQLANKRGDVVIRPSHEAEVLRVAKACVTHKIPLTVRGAGTGNYGQCVPLQGGVILDLTRMHQIKWLKPGLACVEPGVKLAQIDKQAQEIGWEIRLTPSTYRTSTIGGFIGGGSGGIGSITYGQIRDRGNLLAVRVVTMEDEPQIIELQGEAVYQVAHAYGTNGIITELTIPLAPAYAWVEAIATFPDFITAARFGQALGDSDGIAKKLISVVADPIPTFFTALRQYIPTGYACALLMVAENGWQPLEELVQEWNGSVTYRKLAAEAGKGPLLMEYTWNHTTLHARSIDPSLTYLQTLYPEDRELKLIEHLYHYFGTEVMMHLEFLRVGGATRAAGLQVVRYTTETRLNQIIDYHEEHGAYIFNPHTYILEDGGRKVIDQMQVNFKAKVDPYGLLNPGKMRGWFDKSAISG